MRKVACGLAGASSIARARGEFHSQALAVVAPEDLRGFSFKPCEILALHTNDDAQRLQD